MSIAVYTYKPVGVPGSRLAVAAGFAWVATNQPGLVCCRKSCFAQVCGEVAHRAAKRIYLSLVYNEEAGGLVWGNWWSVVGNYVSRFKYYVIQYNTLSGVLCSVGAEIGT